MTIQSKLKLFVASFLIVTALFVVVSLVIFNRLGQNYQDLKTSMAEHDIYEDLKSSIMDFIMAAEGWAVTGNPKFKRLYSEHLAEVYKNFGKLSDIIRQRQGLDAVGREFEELRLIASGAIAMERPVGNRQVFSVLSSIEDKGAALRERLDTLYLSSVHSFSAAISQGERIERQMAAYFTLLVVLSALAFVSLALFMRRMIEVPFRDILTATDRISAGDLDYRISSKRHDEFGVIAGRFDTMVGELQSISERSEDLYLSTRSQLQHMKSLYEIAKAITSTLDMDVLLRMIAEEASGLLKARGCIIRLLEEDRLVIKTSFGLPKEIEKIMTLRIGEGIPGKVAKEARPILVEDMARMPPEWQIPYLSAKSVINIPLMVGSKVIGTIGLYDKTLSGGKVVSFSEEDLRTAEWFAALSAIAIEKAKMFELELQREKEAVEAKRKLDILFESVQGGIIDITRDFSILMVNRFVERWVGIPAPDMIGKSCLEIFHGKKGICPHCVAQATFDTGDANTITQMSGLNYAELTSYPILDSEGRVVECVVYIQDITDRVLYQEEMLALYREGTQTKEYLESLIENSADAIVTSDLDGNITSWNKGAERIYGFAEDEAVGQLLPFVPGNLRDEERSYTERVKNGEVLRDVETVRRRKDNTLIEVSLTLSPIKDATGEIIGISGISRDISEKKRVEKELIRKNQELSRLFFISSAMRSTLDLDRLLRMILTAVTMGEGLGFNRAVLFLVDEDRPVLRGAMGVGPESFEEAGRIWTRLYHEQRSLADVMEEIETGPLRKDSFLDRLSLGLEIPLDAESILSLAVGQQRAFNVADARQEPLSDPVLIQQLGTEAYAVVPLVSRGRTTGVLWVDNLYNRKPITEADMQFLSTFSNQVAAAIESAKLFEKVSFAEAELENIFRSITDMVYFTDMDYTIKSVNRAVTDRFRLPETEIVGKKCYEVFHGMDVPWEQCPHHKTVTQKRSFIEELEDPHLGGTFLTSTSPIFDTAGAFKGTVHIVRDITEIKQIQERLVTSERMAALGEVAAKVAHEIRNPLVSIGGFAQRLEKKLDGNLQEYAAIITNEVKRLEAILKDILGFVREVRLSKTSVDINGIVNDVISLVGAELNERGIALKTELGPVEPVFLDPDRVKEAFLNIVNNSIQAVGTGGEISVRSYPSNGHAVIEISDTGSGINEKDLPFIFDPFYTTKPSGTGLGLAITRRIIEEHRGRIEVRSKPGEGTLVRVQLPKGKEAT